MQGALITQENVSTIESEDEYFKFCSFEGLSMEGKHITSDFVQCEFSNLDCYWTLFNCANFIECDFKDCTFAGVGFPSTRFVDCHLIRCRFIRDNLDGKCDFTGAKAYGCTLEDCEGFEAPAASLSLPAS